MKKILILISIILSSCSLSLNSQKDNIIQPPQGSGEVLVTSGAIEKPISWTGELLFSECEIWSEANSLHGVDKLIAKVEKYGNGFYYIDNPNHPLHTTSTGSSWGYAFGRFIGEHCKTKDKQFVFYSWDKMSPTFGRYDENLDTIEEARFIKKYFPYVGQFSERGAFGKRNHNIIEINSAQIERPNGTISYIEDPLKNPKNRKYCDNGLTPGEKKAECSYTVGYEYDYIKNIFTEKRICSYYRDDENKKQVLEACFDVKY